MRVAWVRVLFRPKICAGFYNFFFSPKPEPVNDRVIVPFSFPSSRLYAVAPP